MERETIANIAVQRIKNLIKIEAKEEQAIEITKSMILNGRKDIDVAMIDNFVRQVITRMANCSDWQHVIRYNAQLDMLNDLLLEILYQTDDINGIQDEYWIADRWIEEFTNRRIHEISQAIEIGDILEYLW